MSQYEIEWGGWGGEEMTFGIYSCEVTVLPSSVKDGESYSDLHHHPEHHNTTQGGDSTFREDRCCSYRSS